MHQCALSSQQELSGREKAVAASSPLKVISGQTTPEKRPHALLRESAIETQNSCVAATPVLRRSAHVTPWLFLSAWLSPSFPSPPPSPPPSRPSASRRRWARI